LLVIDKDRKRRESMLAPDLRINVERHKTLDINDTYRYLGYWGKGNGDMSATREVVREKARVARDNLQPTSDRRLIFASHLATGMVPAVAIMYRLFCLQRTRGSFKYFSKNALLSFCRNMKSAVHVPYAG
jgi:hypothetical protein